MPNERELEQRVHIGLSGWGDHDKLYDEGARNSDKLGMYARHFPVVEMDNSFYAIPSPEQMGKWSDQTPEGFGFIVKAFQGMTGHDRGKGKSYYPNTRAMFDAFKQSAEALREKGKLRAILFQYPPWFQCERKHVEILKRTREWMGDYPLALEFRHQSWFEPGMRDKTLDFIRSEGWIHSIADEPQAGAGSIPTVLEPTQSDAVMVRLHGRNMSGWNSGGKENWREVRYLYRYSDLELAEWRGHVLGLVQGVKQCWVIFNNNSGGDASDNAKQLLRLLGMDSGPEPLRQLDWSELPIISQEIE